MKSLPILFFLFLIPMITLAKPQSIRYTLGMSKPHTHYFEVEVAIENIGRGESTVDFHLPVWRPGRYVVLDLANGVEEFSASNGEGKSLAWKKIDKSTWRVELRGSGSVSIRYKVYANEFNLRTRGLNDEHGFVDGSAVFMYVEKYRQMPVKLLVQPYAQWHVTTGLEEVEGKENEFFAPNYDVFIDCPLEIGNQKDFTFDVDGTKHILSIAGEGNWNADTLIKDISKVVRTTRDIWGNFPYKKFVFLLHCSPTSGGGTEHLNSTIMGMRPFIFKNPESYRGFVGLVAHEYFHTWNVKQLRPKGMHPYNYMKENYTEELWIAEGTTSYYDNLILVRSGYQTAQKYIDDLAAAIQTDRQRPGNTRQSLTESSFDAWVKFWRNNQQSYNSETDYYGKGALVSMVLDLEIRNRSSNKSSLDAVLKTMYQRFPLSGSGYTVKDFQQVIEELAGGNVDDLFSKYVHGTDLLPWEQTLAYAGLEVTQKDTVAKPWIGISLSETNGRTTVNHLPAGSPAYNAGVDFGDEIVAMNGYRVRNVDFAERIKEFAIGETVTLTILRSDKLRTINVPLEGKVSSGYKITKTKTPTDLQKAIYEHWLGASWDEVKK